MKVYNYYKIAPRRKEYLGERYFKVDASSERVIQIVFSVGQQQKGRGHLFGVYSISKLSFNANYLAMKYAIPTTKRDFNNKFRRIIKLLS